MPTRIAIVAYYFKPDQVIGAVRPENWARWIGEGHEVTVVTKEASDQGSVDDPYGIAPAASLSVRLVQRIAAWRSNRRLQRARSSRGDGPTEETSAAAPSGILSYRMPCLHDLWLPACYRMLRRIKPDIIIATHNPYVTIMASWLYALSHPGVKLWLDFRDPWTTNSRAIGAPGFRLIERLIESRALARADMVTSVSEGLCRELNARLGGDTCRLVYNAPAQKVLSSAPPTAEKSAVEICYTGTVYSGWRDPAPLLKLFASLRDEGGLSPREVRLTVASRNPGDLMDVARRCGAREFINFAGMVSRDKARIMQEQADVLLMLESNAPEARGVLTGKLFEYLATDKPVLLVGPGPESELYQVLCRHDRLLSLDDLSSVLRGEASLRPGKPVDYHGIAKGQVEEAVRRLTGLSCESTGSLLGGK